MVTLAAAKNGGEGGGGIRIGGGHCCDILYIAPLVLTSQMRVTRLPSAPRVTFAPRVPTPMLYIYIYIAIH